MKIVSSASELDEGCAFIPTMGALHAGHASLFQLARSKSDYVVASIFINPRQFESAEDLASYPRTPDRDIELAAAAGVTHLWLPQVIEIYPPDFQVLRAGSLGDIYEGETRPGHFDGVVTVLARLFKLLKPKIAIFGEKDFQQLTLIRNHFSNLEIMAGPTLREADGLAMSSRNVGLDESAREKAQILYRALDSADRSPDLESARITLLEVAKSERTFELDYAEIIDEESFAPASMLSVKKRAIIAGWLNGVRLIDNMQMNFGGVR